MAGEERSGKSRLVGINHVALEVGDIDEALAFWGRLFEVTAARPERHHGLHRHGRSVHRALEQAATRSRTVTGTSASWSTTGRRSAARSRQMGVEILPGRGLDFLDPWGNRIQVVDYRDIQFTKAPEVLDAMGLGQLDKSPAALDELARKGIRFS